MSLLYFSRCRSWIVLLDVVLVVLLLVVVLFNVGHEFFAVVVVNVDHGLFLSMLVSKLTIDVVLTLFFPMSLSIFSMSLMNLTSIDVPC